MHEIEKTSRLIEKIFDKVESGSFVVILGIIFVFHSEMVESRPNPSQSRNLNIPELEPRARASSLNPSQIFPGPSSWVTPTSPWKSWLVKPDCPSLKPKTEFPSPCQDSASLYNPHLLSCLPKYRAFYGPFTIWNSKFSKYLKLPNLPKSQTK